ncbi:unnamed protein product [Pleuronectes platessa]|uniref:Small integral membrane protein 5 n=1 Tax=Pleuronectes platessa TaxID=8262 RepID=A0A9N7V376_PLEPL|nr:unnamed protein product [Pleuronectes platessa]
MKHYILSICSLPASRRMDAGEQTLTLLSRVWVKLQNLPSANGIDLGAFFVLLTFILMVVAIAVVTCLSCCCCCRCCKAKMKGPNI